jgi:D-alanyl-D-alanine carboxypeptidase/D-alanyl-D-alanine-endopeptidase (penicillin-binding protein 4)
MWDRAYHKLISNQLLLIFLVLFSSCAASRYHVAKVPLKNYFETNPVFRESHSGLIVYDPEKSETLFDYNAHKHFTPASNTKLLTWYAALKMLGDSIPSLSYCEVNDTLYFSVTGDPTLLYENFDYARTLDFLQSSTQHLVYVEKQMADERFGPGWSWDDYPYYYSAEKSAFPIYGNMVRFKKKSADDYVEVIPNHFENSFAVIQDTSARSFLIERKEFENEFILKFKSNPSEIDSDVPFMYANNLFIKLLSDTLNRPVYHQKSFPECKTELYYSVPTDSVAKHILIESDNFLAEQMLLVISSQLGDTLSSNRTIEFMIENHLADLEDQIHWVDGSGLSRYNQLTPNALVSVLDKIYHTVPKEKRYSFLPEPGKKGTLRSSFLQLEKNIHAKTGSMSHVYNLSGYLETNSGKTLLFSFMNNNFNVSFSELKNEMEKVLKVFVND